jgi:hypothetical protein
MKEPRVEESARKFRARLQWSAIRHRSRPLHCWHEGPNYSAHGLAVELERVDQLVRNTVAIAWQILPDQHCCTIIMYVRGRSVDVIRVSLSSYICIYGHHIGCNLYHPPLTNVINMLYSLGREGPPVKNSNKEYSSFITALLWNRYLLTDLALT